MLDSIPDAEAGAILRPGGIEHGIPLARQRRIAQESRHAGDSQRLRPVQYGYAKLLHKRDAYRALGHGLA